MNTDPVIKAFVTTIGLSMLAGLMQGCAAGVAAGAVAGGAAMAYDRRTTGTIIDDQLIELKALDSLRRDDEAWSQSHVSVTSYNGIVLLTGEAPTESLRRRIQSRVASVDKVRQVHNELALAGPSAVLSRSGDSWITSKVKGSLLKEQNIEAARIKVVTDKGIVYLMGLVTREEAAAATETARSVSGVQRVVKLFEHLD